MMKFSIKFFFSKCDQIRSFLKFTEEIRNPLTTDVSHHIETCQLICEDGKHLSLMG